MLLSIIIPIYKVEKYIRGTLNSIYNQNFDINNFEVICVNDGTPDKSMDIVDTFAQKYKNLIIVNQNNSGLSAARNAGARVAVGKYIWFVDSDDKIAKNSINNIIDVVNSVDSDVYFFAIRNISEQSNKIWIEYPIVNKRANKYYNKVVSGDILCNNIHIGISPKNIYNRLFFISKSLWFNETIIHEDNEQGVRLLAEATKCYCSKSIIYEYLRRPSGSITTSSVSRSINSRFKIIRIWDEYLLNSNQTYINEKIIYHYIFLQIYNLLSTFDNNQLKFSETYSFDNKKLKKKAITSFYKSICFCSIGKVIRFVALLLNLKIKV